MQVTATLVDWQEALKRRDSGTLAETIWEAVDEGEPWVDQDVPWESDSHVQYTFVGEAYDALRGRLAERNRARADMFMNALIWDGPSGHLQDLGEGLEFEIFSITISPQTTASLVELVGQIDFSEFREAYERCCSREIKKTLDPYDLNFIGYIQQWTALLQMAAEQQRGIVISIS